MSRQSPVMTLLLAVFSLSVVFVLVTHPETSFQAALRGLKIWWEVVFPALLPFIVVSEILMGIGVVHFVGVLLEPLMRPVFNVPGTGGFVLTMGFSSGYPVAAKLTVRLREQGIVTRTEGERLVSFATTGDPLFVIGAVAVGFFHSEQLGFVMAASHYLSALILGVMYRYYAAAEEPRKPLERGRLPLLYRAVLAMHRARVRDGRPFGQLMGDAVQSALHTLLLVGGFIILFSVLLQQLLSSSLSQAVNVMLAVLLGPLGIPADFARPLLAGLFEVTLGAQAVSEVPASVPLAWKAAVASALVSWGGLSVHAQVASILSQTDLRVAPYLMARGLHAVMSAVLTLILWKPLAHTAFQPDNGISVFLADHPAFLPPVWPEILHGSARLAFFVLTALGLASWAAWNRRKRRPTA